MKRMSGKQGNGKFSEPMWTTALLGVGTLQIKRRENMEEKKKEAIKKMAEEFVAIPDEKVKSMAMIVMNAYVEGVAAGKASQSEEKTA